MLTKACAKLDSSRMHHDEHGLHHLQRFVADDPQFVGKDQLSVVQAGPCMTASTHRYADACTAQEQHQMNSPPIILEMQPLLAYRA
mmetsp:Transcript_30773/g.91434  ORF Transcript_30773/g.91434 Transcript_30773/m.91434 type:complete len:86 (+) Transcript_30773:152-409(+)|eukprot:27387-Chlamydomonas_euryale.AAC.13